MKEEYGRDGYFTVYSDCPGSVYTMFRPHPQFVYSPVVKTTLDMGSVCIRRIESVALWKEHNVEKVLER